MQLVVVSGKGGTGKTTITACFSKLAKDAISCDCDVDASNLYLLFPGEELEAEAYYGGKVAMVNEELCTKCGKCMEVCKFNAIASPGEILNMSCEGCGACTWVCEPHAITLKTEQTGSCHVSKWDKGLLSRGALLPGGEGSGKLVAQVRKRARAFGTEDQMYILDGTPGIGCAVMASITGCDEALVVVEPSQSSLEDFKRVYELLKYFNVNTQVCINKYDLDVSLTVSIKKFCRDEGLDVIGLIPFDPMVQKAINSNIPVVDMEDSIAGKAIREMWYRIV